MSGERCCPGAGSMAHVRGCANHPEHTPTPVPSEVAETTAGEREVEALLAEHEYLLNYRSGAICSCGHVPEIIPKSLQTQQDYHRAHIATILAALLDRVRREEGAKVLREAAERHVAELVCCDVFERLHEKPSADWTDAERTEMRRHAICYWGAACAEGDLDRAASVGRGEGL